MGLLSKARENQKSAATPSSPKNPLDDENVSPSNNPSANSSAIDAQNSTTFALDENIENSATSAKVQNAKKSELQSDIAAIKESLSAAQKISNAQNQSESEQRAAAKEQLQALLQGQSIKTVADDIYNLIAQSGKIKISEIHKRLNLSAAVVKKYIDVMVQQAAISIIYPLNVFSSPIVSLNLKDSFIPEKIRALHEKGTLLEKYNVLTDHVVADINIWSIPKEITPIYQIIPHLLGRGTECVMNDLVRVLADKIPVSSTDINNPRRVLEFRQVFYETALVSVQNAFSGLDEITMKFLAGVLVHRTYGLGDIEIIMADNWLEEVAINGATEPISLYHKRYGWLKTTKFLDKEDEIYNFAAQISRRVGKQIDALNPIMDAHLQTGDRVAATLFPISTEGDTITIRRFSRNPWTVTHMIDPKIHTMSSEVLALLWEVVQYELNYMVVGGTASGKTSVLNTLASLIPPTNRVISIEDTREITLPEALHWNWVPLASKSANTEGQGEVTMLDLMVASLRMRPDRILVGEIRRKQQAEAMFEAMHTGHSVSATMHADTAEQIKRRLTQPPIDIPENEIQALQLVIVQYRDRRKGVRRTLEVAELLPGASGEKINLNYLYRWRPRSDEFIKDNESIRIVEDLNLHTGMTQTELDEDLHTKKEILEWLLKNNIRDVDTVGNIMSVYYKFPDLLIDTVKDNGQLSNLFNKNT